MRPSLHYRFGILDLEAERINVLCVDDDPALALEDGGAALAEGQIGGGADLLNGGFGVELRQHPDQQARQSLRR